MEARKVLPEFWPDDIRKEIGSIPVYLVPMKVLKEAGFNHAMIAFVNHHIPAIYLVREHIEGMSDEALKVVLMHEMCHLKQPWATEKECDKYAIDIVGIDAYAEAVAFTKDLEKRLHRPPAEREYF